MRQGGSNSHGGTATTTPEVTQYVGHVMGIAGGGQDHACSDGHHHQVVGKAASPISSRPPARQASFNKPPAMVGDAILDGEDELSREEAAERGGLPAGNRWPRPETLTLLKIRSDMDAVFRDATLKGPLWEDVSRKMGEMGYNRSAKKCKEKFENVHKYYKRTKEGNARRQDGKSYRFFTQLEALHGTIAISGGTMAAFPATDAASSPVPPATVTHNNSITAGRQIFPPAPGNTVVQQTVPPIDMVPSGNIIVANEPIRQVVVGKQNLTRTSADMSTGEISLSSGESSSTSGESSEETQGNINDRKRKRSSSEAATHKMMDFFKDLMKQVVEKQVEMQQRLLEVVEKREEDRTAREEAWRRQEMARLSRELDILVQERALSASRDAAMMSLLQNFTGQAIVFPRPPQPILPPSPAEIPISPIEKDAAIPQKQTHRHQHPQERQYAQQSEHLVTLETRPIQPCNNVASSTQLETRQIQSPCTAAPPPEKRPIEAVNTICATPPTEMAVANLDPVLSSRWPKVEVLALIKLRTGLESRYQDAGPKGPLWEEISSEMGRLGYKRSAKRCKEKWENINKYFKKVKEGNKRRHEHAKTCPYFDELEALHNKKMMGGKPTMPVQEVPGTTIQLERMGGDRMPIMPTPISVAAPSNYAPETIAMEHEVTNNGGSEMHVHSTGLYSSLAGDKENVAAAKKPEHIMWELMEQRQQQQAVVDDYAKMDDPEEDDSDTNSAQDEHEGSHDSYETPGTGNG